jgi:hypothetical protein
MGFFLIPSAGALVVNRRSSIGLAVGIESGRWDGWRSWAACAWRSRLGGLGLSERVGWGGVTAWEVENFGRRLYIEPAGRRLWFQTIL